MPTTIRLNRMGKKKRPFYRLVVLDSRKRRDGAYLANLGHYNPFVEPPEVELHTDDILSWLAKGATVSETARSLLKREGVLYRHALRREGLDDAEIDRRVAEWREGAAARVDRHEQDRLRRIRHIEEAEQKRREQAAAAKAQETGDAASAAETDAAESAASDEGADAAAEGETS